MDPVTVPPYRGAPAPPLSARTAVLTGASVFTRIKKAAATALLGAFIFGVLWVIGALFDVGWLPTVGYVVVGLLIVVGIFDAATARVTDCPYCGGRLGSAVIGGLTASDENLQIECGRCFEWLVSHQGEVRAFGTEDASGRESFDAPVFKAGVWPAECVVCGAPPARLEGAKRAKVELSKLLLGALSVASASVNGIPYCDEHGGAVSVTIKDDHPRMVFDDYAARRRYVAANRGKPVTKM